MECRHILVLALIYFSLFKPFEQKNCPKDKPIEKSDECQLIYCSKEQFQDNTCLISSEIIKTQWLNNVVFFGFKSSFYFDYTIDSNNNIIFISSTSNDEELYKYRQLYGLNSYGELLFNDVTEKNIISNDNPNVKQCNVIIYVEIKNSINDNTNFILDCDINICELIDYLNEKIYLIKLFDFESELQPYGSKFSLFQLNSKDQYFIGNVLKSETGNYYLGLFKFKLSYNSENNNFDKEIVCKNNYNSFIITQNDVTSCFETENNIIECLYISYEEMMSLGIFDSNLEQLAIFELEKILPENEAEKDFYFFFKGINLQREIGVYIYFYNAVDPPRFLIKNLIYNQKLNKYELNDILNLNYIISSKEDKSLDVYANFFELFDLFKITSTKFGYVYLKNYAKGEVILVLFDLFGKNLDNMSIKYYELYLILNSLFVGRNLKGIVFNNYIGIGFGNSREDSSDYTNYSVFMIFGYNKFIYSEKILNNINSDNNNMFIVIKINDYFNNNITEINNNLLGYQYIGIKVLSLTGLSSGIKYYLNNNKEISINDIINISSEIKIDYSNSDLKIPIKDEYIIEIGSMISECDYDKIDYYADKVENYGDLNYKDYYDKQTFITQKVKIKYNFSCNKNCLTCKYVSFSSDNQSCLSCPNNHCLMKQEGNCYDIINNNYYYYKNLSDNIIYCVPKNEYCPGDYSFENTITKECKSTISYEEFLSNNILPSNSPKSIETMHDLLYDLLKNSTINPDTKDTIIKGNNVTFQLTKIENQDYGTMNNISSVNLNECENLLKQKYNIQGSLIILKIDIKRNDTISTQVEYQIINPDNNEILNLSICENTTIDIYAPINLDTESLNLYKDLKDKGYDLYNSQDDFYNDICTPYDTGNGTDIILSDRKKYLYNDNIPFCEDNCKYNEIDTHSLKVNCKCNVKKEIQIEQEKNKFKPNVILENFYKISSYTNLNVIKCYKLV